MHPMLKEALVGFGVFLATLIVSALVGLPFGTHAGAGYLVSAGLVLGLTFALARGLGVRTLASGTRTGAVWLAVTAAFWLAMGLVGDAGSALYVLLFVAVGVGPVAAALVGERAGQPAQG